MKIGILTLPLHTNYGGILQAYALQTVLERMGHKVIVYNLDRKPLHCGLYVTSLTFIRRVLSSIKHRVKFTYYNLNKESENYYQEFMVKTQFTQPFIDRYIHCYYLKNHTVEIIGSNVDCVIVGSDQIWDFENGMSIAGSVSNAFLPFLGKSKIKRFSYAASFGKDTWNYTIQQTQISREAIKAFTGISVRESSGIDLCKQYLGMEATQHIDPTMLLTNDDYINNLGISKLKSSSGNMLVYILDRTSEKDLIVQYIEEKLSLKKFRVNSKAEDITSQNVKIQDKIQPPVERWLRGFFDAKFVVTDSFHACVFSILFHKPFIVIGNKHRGLTRFVSLLSKFGLEDRLINKLDDIDKLDLRKTIDFTNTEEVLHRERRKSIEYIASNLL